MKFLFKLIYKITHNNITTGECDFCDDAACVGAQVGPDVFYLCERHKQQYKS